MFGPLRNPGDPDNPRCMGAYNGGLMCEVWCHRTRACKEATEQQEKAAQAEQDNEALFGHK